MAKVIVIPVAFSTLAWVIAAALVVDAFRRAYKREPGIVAEFFAELVVALELLFALAIGLAGWVLRLYGL